jgi:hypothetical protein
VENLKRGRLFSVFLLIICIILILFSLPPLSLLEIFVKNPLYISVIRFVFTLICGALLSYIFRIEFDKIIERIYEKSLEKQRKFLEDYWERFFKSKIERTFESLKTEMLRITLRDYIKAFAPEIGDDVVNEVQFMLERLRSIIREDYRRTDEIIIKDNSLYIEILTTMEYFLKSSSQKIIPYIFPKEELRCYILFYTEEYAKENRELYDEIKKAEKYFYAWKVNLKPNNPNEWADSYNILLTVENAFIDGKKVVSEILMKNKGIEVSEVSLNHFLLRITRKVAVPSNERTRIRLSLNRKALYSQDYFFYTRELIKNATITLRVISSKTYKIVPYLYMWSINRPIVHSKQGELVIDIEGIIFPYSAVHFSINPK